MSLKISWRNLLSEQGPMTIIQHHVPLGYNTNSVILNHKKQGRISV